MASSSTNNPNGSDPNSSTPNTTFVQADPSNFRAVVQRLTGATQDSSSVKLPVTGSGPAGPPRRPAFKLHERRQMSARKLEIMLNNGGCNGPPVGFSAGPLLSPSSSSSSLTRKRSFLASPVSPLEMLTRGSPRTPRSPMEEEEKAIAEKGFYLHPSPLSTPRGSEPPELLPLFPLQSPTARNDSSSSY
ncbi:VQ motif-containing protein 11-like [Nicotiana tabacum]|uniref:VQ motif-containing protein 11-like n=1 Tax=Nicotiana tabacum TaxID=4097 RepID=A0A1S4CS33_TOBAC|nr:VQ motif-containing protein 11-like [Nicotiana tomentosiformis]XP_016503918.1 PREDICTED: VQ motif-containing protein 11-like [Nicotiana tabacum]